MLDMSRTSGLRVGRLTLTTALLLALLSATGAPTPKTLAKLIAGGIDPAVAAALLHIAPVAVGALSTWAGQAFARGRSRLVRFSAYAFYGAATGVALGVCLDLFVGLGAFLQQTAHLGDPHAEHIVGWALAALSLIWAATTGAVGAFGPAAAQALQDFDAGADCVDVRTAERVMFRQSGAGLAGQAVCIAALTILDQGAPEGALRAALIAAAVTGAGAFAAASWVMWRAFDEMMRRVVLIAYMWTAAALTAGAFGWAVADAAGIAVRLSPVAILVSVAVIQTFAAGAAGLGVHSELAPARRRPA